MSVKTRSSQQSDPKFLSSLQSPRRGTCNNRGSPFISHGRACAMVGTKTPHRTKRPRRSTRLLLSLAEPEFATGGSGEMQDADENIDELQPLPKRPYQCDSKPRGEKKGST